MSSIILTLLGAHKRKSETPCNADRQRNAAGRAIKIFE